ncbi:hypothetical protein [Photobacterium carnosum]|uniref:hypothetical protein n=1 Tax=Photobacterium carnosum TaxID=2023717 RepID=UPI001E3DA945|nr:hypothetical protein [Photobacterium carnosum]MCD9516431.1 hypothetical protein [Photobacterium carnosum]
MRAYTSNSDCVGITNINNFEAVRGVYDDIVRALRANGWKVRKYKRADSGYITDNWGFAYNGNLKIRIEKDFDKKHNFNYCYGFDFKLFEDVTPCDNPNGGIYRNDCFQAMPYLLKLLAIKTVNLIKQCLISSGFEFPEDFSYVGFQKPKLSIDIIKMRNESGRMHIKEGMDRAEYQQGKRISQDNEILDHKQQAYMRHNGRLIRGVIYYDTGNWIFVYGKCGAYCNVQPGELIVNPKIKKGRVFSERTTKGRLQTELSRAVNGADYLRAHQLKQIIIKDEMYRIWSTKYGGEWWRVNASGYTHNINNAGLFKKEEAERLCKNNDNLTMKKAA